MSLIFVDRCSLPLYSDSRLRRVWEDRVFPREVGQVYKTRISVSGREFALIHLPSLKLLPHFFHRRGDFSSV